MKHRIVHLLQLAKARKMAQCLADASDIDARLQQFNCKRVTKRMARFFNSCYPEHLAIKIIGGDKAGRLPVPTSRESRRALRKGDRMSVSVEHAFRWEDLDQRLLTPKLQDLAEEMQ